MQKHIANNKTLLKAIERKEKQIGKQMKKLRWAKSIKERDKAREEIARLSSEELKMRQQIKLNMVMSDVQRAKNTKGNVEEHAPIKTVSGCDNLGDECPW